MKKKFLSITLASTMALGTLTGAFAVDESEVHTSNPYINGYEDGTFRPSNDVKRGEVAKMIAVMKTLETGAGSSFEDTKGHWAAGFITAVKEEGIVEGYPDSSFRPENGLTRAEMATIISRLIGESSGAGSVALSDIDGHWAEDHIMNAVKEGIILGYPDGTFAPDQEVTRAEAVKMLNGVIGILSVDGSIKDLVENPFSDIGGFWAEDHILAASTEYSYTLDADGKLVVVTEEEGLKIESLAAVTGKDNKTIVSATVLNAEEGASAVVTIVPDEELELEDIVIEDVSIDEDGKVVLDLGILPEGTHTVKIAVGEVSESLEFTVDNTATNAAVAAAEAALEAYVLAGGVETDAVYTAVEAALEAEPFVLQDLLDATEALETETAELVVFAEVTAAETAAEMRALLFEFENSAYIDLSSAQKLEFSGMFIEAVAEEEPADYNAVSILLTAELSAYTTVINGVNNAETISEMTVALTALGNEDFNALSASEKADVSEAVLTGTPYETLSEIVAAMGL